MRDEQCQCVESLRFDTIYDEICPLDGLETPTLHVLLVHLDHFLHFVVATHKNSGPVMNVLRYDGEHTLHSTIDRLAAG